MQLLPQHTGDLQDKSQAQMHRKSLAASGRLSAVAAGAELCCTAPAGCTRGLGAPRDPRAQLSPAKLPGLPDTRQ